MIGEDGRITEAAPERFRGMSVDDARAAVVAALREEDLISGAPAYATTFPTRTAPACGSSRSSRSSGSAT